MINVINLCPLFQSLMLLQEMILPMILLFFGGHIETLIGQNPTIVSGVFEAVLIDCIFCQLLENFERLVYPTR